MVAEAHERIRVSTRGLHLESTRSHAAYLVVPATAYRNTGLGSGIPDYRMAGLEKA